MDTIEIYKKNETPPEWALKTIAAGRTKGMTDINPQWRYLALTETFGLCGIGWYYETTRQWLEKGGNDVICAFVNINLYVKVANEWSKAIPGNGGASFVANEKGGLYTSDEAYKMATTDALSVACKMLGVGAGVYSGSKYTQFQAENEQKEYLISAITEMQKAASLEELKEIWTKYKSLQLVQEFIDEKNKRKSILE